MALSTPAQVSVIQDEERSHWQDWRVPLGITSTLEVQGSHSLRESVMEILTSDELSRDLQHLHRRKDDFEVLHLTKAKTSAQGGPDPWPEYKFTQRPPTSAPEVDGYTTYNGTAIFNLAEWSVPDPPQGGCLFFDYTAPSVTQYLPTAVHYAIPVSSEQETFELRAVVKQAVRDAVYDATYAETSKAISAVLRQLAISLVP